MPAGARLDRLLTCSSYRSCHACRGCLRGARMTEPWTLPSARDIADANAVAPLNLAGMEQSGGSYFAHKANDRSAAAPAESNGVDVVGILSAVQETIYTWDIACDRIDWANNAREVLGVRSHGNDRHRFRFPVPHGAGTHPAPYRRAVEPDLDPPRRHGRISRAVSFHARRPTQRFLALARRSRPMQV